MLLSMLSRARGVLLNFLLNTSLFFGVGEIRTWERWVVVSYKTVNLSSDLLPSENIYFIAGKKTYLNCVCNFYQNFQLICSYERQF